MVSPNLLRLAQFGVLLALLKVFLEVLVHVPKPEWHARLESRLRKFAHALKKSASESICPTWFSFFESTYNRAFGTASFWCCAKISSLLLLICLAIGGMFSGTVLCMTQYPWDVFGDLTQKLAQHSAPLLQDPRLNGAPGSASLRQNLMDIGSLHGSISAAVFTLWFVLVILGTTAACFRYSVVLSSRIFKDLTIERSLFSRVLVLIATLVLVLVLGAGQFCALSIGLNVWIWPFIPVFLILLRVVPVLGLALTAGLFLLTALLWDLWLLRVVLLISVGPLLLVLLLVAASIFIAPFKGPFLRALAVLTQLALRSPRGPLAFLAVLCSAGILFCSFLVWLARLQFDPLSVRVLGLAFLFLLSSYLVGRFNRSHAPSTSLGFLTASLLFVIIVGLVVLGFFLEAILGCYLSEPIPPGAPYEILLSSLFPAGVAAFCIVRFCTLQFTFLRVFIPLLSTLLFFDAEPAFAWFISYRDVLFSFCCDFVGASLAAMLLQRGYRVLCARWPSLASQPVGHVPRPTGVSASSNPVSSP